MAVLSRFSLLLTLLFTALVGVIYARPADSPLRRLLTSSDGCAPPCFMGIRPGVTTLDEALAILGASEQVAGITRQTSYVDVLHWQWAGAPNDVIDPAVPGRLLIEDEVINEISVGTRLTFGDVWLLLGPAQRGSFMIGALSVPSLHPGFQSAAFHTALYPDASLQVAFQATCPIRLQSFWHANIQIRWISSANRYVNQRFYLPAWNDRSCQ